MTRQQEIAATLHRQLPHEQMAMVWELVSLSGLGSTSIEDAIEMSGWQCPDCGLRYHHEELADMRFDEREEIRGVLDRWRFD